MVAHRIDGEARDIDVFVARGFKRHPCAVGDPALCDQAGEGLLPQPAAIGRVQQENVARLPRRHHRLRSEEHTSELQSLMRTSYAVFCLTEKSTTNDPEQK